MSIFKKTFTWIALLFPPLAFYALLVKSRLAVPFDDDYHVVLGFLLRWKQESGISHILEIVTYQDNDYRLMFENTFIGIQYALLGHVNLEVLAFIGNLFVLPLFGVLYLIWRQCGRAREYTLLAFVPASWILFQLQYAGALNNVTGSLQLIPIVMFALLTLFLASQASKKTFLWALLSLLFCIASNANGLFLIPIGAALFLQRKEYKRLAAWCCCSVAACMVYFYKYNFKVGEAHAHSSNNVISIFQHFSPAYALAFLGDIAAIRNPLPAILYGAILCGVLIYATWDRLFEKRPALYYSALFFFVTGVAVSGHRSVLGLTTAMNSPYRINSTLLTILLYLYLADKFYGIRIRPLVFRTGICIFAALLLAFNIASSWGGEKLLLSKRHKLEVALLRWERHEPRPLVTAITPGDLTADSEMKGKYEPIEPTLSDAIREGIYILPNLPMGN
jgi:hypothetical protein